MAVSWRIALGIIFVVSDEQATLAEWRSAVTVALISPDYRPGMRLLHDARRMERIPTPDEVRMRLSFLALEAGSHRLDRWASVVDASSAIHGVARVAEAHATQFVNHERSVTFRVFTDMVEAEAWLREPLPAT